MRGCRSSSQGIGGHRRTLAQPTVLSAVARLGAWRTSPPNKASPRLFLFLENYNEEMNKTAEVREVLGDLNSAIDGKSSDPASWSHWLKAISRAKRP
jgi:hypothetical protein